MIFETGRPGRKHDYSQLGGKIAAAARAHSLTSTVGVPIVLDGRVWGIICVAASGGERLPADTEAHLFGFTELVATALASIEAREDIRRLAFEQAALRRVATLVAEGVPATELFAGVAEEIAHVLDVAGVTLDRYESDATTTVLGTYGDTNPNFTVGSRWPLDGPSLAASVLETGGPARFDDYSELPGTIAAAMREGRSISTAAVPILVDGRVWGVICVCASQSELLPRDIETRLRDITELVATAVSNATTRAELIASRARIVAAGDEARRRIERDLHDGIQQRLVSLVLRARATKTRRPTPDELQSELSFIADDLLAALDEIREISRGIHPAILSEAGLGPALNSLARRSAVPIALDLNLESRLEDSLEAAAYYVTSEALTNVVKHAEASAVELQVRCRHGFLELLIRDDGVGGADASRGSGIVGLIDRVEALGGTITVVSPVGDGTTLDVRLPARPPPEPPPDAELEEPLALRRSADE
jgi:signal transduction histidine kinase